MTLKEFFRSARERKWAVSRGLVRCADGLCPLGAVSNYAKPFGIDPGYQIPPPVASDHLDISLRLAWKIARAADGKRSRNRKWLLKNLGIRA